MEGSVQGSTSQECPATREAVQEHEEFYGDINCPICGYAAEAHPPDDAPEELADV